MDEDKEYEQMVHVDDISNEYSLDKTAIIDAINDGRYNGKKVNGHYFVFLSCLLDPKVPWNEDQFKNYLYPMKKRLFVWLGLPPSISDFIDNFGYRDIYELKIVIMFMVGTAVILIASYIFAETTYKIVSEHRIKNNIRRHNFGKVVTVIVILWFFAAAIFGFAWNDISILQAGYDLRPSLY